MGQARVLEDLLDLLLHLLRGQALEPAVEPDVLLHRQPGRTTGRSGASRVQVTVTEHHEGVWLNPPGLGLA